VDEESVRQPLKNGAHEAAEEFANFTERGVRVRNQSGLVDAADRHERDQRQQRGGPVAGEDQVLDGTAGRVEEVFGVAVARAFEVDRRVAQRPAVDLAQYGAVSISGVIHKPDVVS
jgi:hypothetical protein